MSKKANTFSGMMSITNLTSGLSSGRTPVVKWSDSVYYKAQYYNKYGASLSGTAYLLGIPVATVMPNYITWTNTAR